MALKTLARSTLDEVFAVRTEKRSLISIPASSSQLEALKILGQNNILSAPVYDEKKNYIGIVNRRALITSLAFAPVDEKEISKTKFDDDKIPELSESVGNLLEVTRESSKLYSYKGNDILPSLLDSFSQGVHRILVETEGGDPVFLSQTDVLRFLYQHREQLEGLRYVEVQNMKGDRKVVTINADTPALTAFRSLLINHVRAAPVVDQDGKLVTSLSLSDVRKIDRDNLKELLLPVSVFLAKMYGAASKPVTVAKGDVLEAVVAKMLEHHVHQVWVVEGEKPVGVVAMTDICVTVFQDEAVQDAYAEYKALVKKSADLLTIPLADLIKDHKAAITIAEDASLKSALTTLADNKFTSVPVSGKDGKVSGLLDVLALLTPFLLHSKLSKPSEVKEDVLKSVLESSLAKPVTSVVRPQSQDGGSYSVEWVSLESPDFLVFASNERLHKVLNAFSQGYHRVIVADKDAHKLFSQSDLVAYLNASSGKWGDIMQSKLEDLISTEGKLKKLEAGTQTLAAFRELLINDVRAAPVVDASGKVISSLSISNLRGIRAEDVKDLLLSVADYLKQHGAPAPVTVAKSSSLQEAIAVTVKNRVHRLWVVDEAGKPLGVLSLTDIIKAVLLDKISRD